MLIPLIAASVPISTDKLVELCERMARVETLLANHLQSHQQWFWFFLVPVSVGILVGIIQNVYLRKQIKRNDHG